MADSAHTACPSCGARVPAGAEVCDLCGAALASDGATDADRASEADSAKRHGDAPAAAASGASAAPQAAGVYCNECGWQNPPGAKYCSQCGHALQETPAQGASSQDASTQGTPVRPAALPAGASAKAAEAPAEERARGEERASGGNAAPRQVALVVGAAVLVVAGLFFVTSWSQSADFGAADAPAATEAQGGGATAQAAASDPTALIEDFAPAEPLPENIRAEAEQVQQTIDGQSGVRKRAAQQQLVNLYAGAGLNDRAAVVQYRIAEEAGSADAWERAGSLLFDWWMDVDAPRRTDVAQLTVNAYQRVLEERPGDVDVRTNMAIAYLDTNNPMQGVQEIQRVLEEDPDHVQARLNYGIMLLQIGRLDQAVEQFERVQEVAGAGTPRHEQAQQFIERVEEARQQQGQQGSGSPASNAPIAPDAS